MTKEKQAEYEDTQILKQILEPLKGRKFKLECGHHVTLNHSLGNDITVYNGKHLKIICSQCGY